MRFDVTKHERRDRDLFVRDDRAHSLGAVVTGHLDARARREASEVVHHALEVLGHVGDAKLLKLEHFSNFASPT